MTTKAYVGPTATMYDAHHFGGPSGRHVYTKDCTLLSQLVTRRSGLALDVPSGTGKYSRVLQELGLTVVASDISGEMLLQGGKQGEDLLQVIADIRMMPFASATFDVILTMRLFQHLPVSEVTSSLVELHRLVKPDGEIVFDTFRWTPRNWRWLPRRLLGEGRISAMSVYSDVQVESMVAQAGLRVKRRSSSYLFSPILYRQLPLALVRALDLVEKGVPDELLLRTFWVCARA